MSHADALELRASRPVSFPMTASVASGSGNKRRRFVRPALWVALGLSLPVILPEFFLYVRQQHAVVVHVIFSSPLLRHKPCLGV